MLLTCEIHFGTKLMKEYNEVTLKSFLSVSFLMLLLLGLIISGCSPGNSAWKTYRSPIVGRFQIMYPSSWSANVFPNGYHNDQQAIAVIHAQTPFALPSVRLAEKQMESPTLETVIHWGEERFLDLNDTSKDKYEIFDVEYLEINSQQIATRKFVMDQETPLPLRKKDVYLINGDRGFIFTFTAEADRFDEQVKIFDEMIMSFKFLEET